MSSAVSFAARRGYFVIALSVLVLDQATKITAHRWLANRGPVEIIPSFLNLSYSRNAGGLFGYFRDLPDPWRSLLLMLLPLAAVAMITWFLARGEGDDRRSLWGLALILGGAVGNLIDRIFRGEVVDFLDVYAASPGLADWLIERFGTAHWPTFNLADSAIVTGAGLLLLTIVRPPATESRSRSDNPSEAAG